MIEIAVLHQKCQSKYCQIIWVVCVKTFSGILNDSFDEETARFKTPDNESFD